MTLAPDALRVEVAAAAFGAPERAGGSGGAAVGVVVETGAAATRLLGVRVLVGPVLACGECDACRRGKLLACPRVHVLGQDEPGALGGTVTASSRWACPLDGALDGALPGPTCAALPREALALYTLHARAGLGPGDPTIWLGEDPLARLGAALARAAGAVVLTPSAPTDADAGDLVRTLDGELAAAGARRVAWTILDASGGAAARAQALALATRGGGGGGTAALLAGRALGLPPGDASLVAALDAEVRVISVAAPHPDLLPELAALVHKGVLDLAPHVEVAPWTARDLAPTARVRVLAR